MLNIENFKLKNTNLVNTPVYLVGVSGGVDSMVLLHLLLQCKIVIEVAHVNYQLRGKDSDLDAKLVEVFCEENQIVMHKKVVDTKLYLEENKVGLQEGARNIRYLFFNEILEQRNRMKIITAHHANDNIETVLMHIARGTGLKGLTGIQPEGSLLVRPLLSFTKTEIVDYAIKNNITYREDASNATNDYTRNAIRNILIPEWQKIQPNFENNMLQNISIWNGANEIYESHVKKVLSKLWVIENGNCCIPIRLLLKQGNVAIWLYEILKHFSFNASQIVEAQKLLCAENGKFIKNKIWRIYRDRNFLVITKITSISESLIIIEDANKEIEFGFSKLSFEQVDKPENLQTTANVCLVNIEAIRFPLLLRHARVGDYFFPLGMPKKKKISKFLIDLKLSQTQKESVWVLESEKKIIWVVGQRMDERFKVKNTSEKVMQIKLTINKNE
jgi:tRNA(Ile)-lysidine synthase